MKQTGLIGILGGLGPEAGRLLHGYIIEEAAKKKKISCDQDHYDVLHFSLPSIVPDRASYIFDQSAPDPTPIIFTILQAMGQVAKGYGRPLSICIPCNTYHAPILFDPLKDLLQKSDMRSYVHLMNLIEESALAVGQFYPELNAVGLISTSGERASGIYRYYLSQQNLDIIQVDDEEQKLVDDTIYNPHYGLKATSLATPFVKESLNHIVMTLKQRGAQVIILGCTELPFLFTQDIWNNSILLSPMRIMAKRLIEVSDKILSTVEF